MEEKKSLRIEIPAFSLNVEKIWDVKHSYVVLGKDVLHFRRKYMSTIPKSFDDALQGTIDRVIDFSSVIRKDDIKMIELNKTVPTKEGDKLFWLVSVQGGVCDFDAYFEYYAEAKTFSDQIFAWLGWEL